MSQTKFLKISGPSMKPGSKGLGRLLVRLLVLSVVVCVLLIRRCLGYLAHSGSISGAVLRQPSCGCVRASAVAALVFVRPHWRAQLGVAGAIVLVTAWSSRSHFQYARLAAPRLPKRPMRPGLRRARYQIAPPSSSRFFTIVRRQTGRVWSPHERFSALK